MKGSKRLVAVAAVMLAAGCNFAPRYAAPKGAKLASFKEAVPSADAAAQGFKVAEPRDAELRGNWWEMYGDPELDDLESRVVISNQSIAVAEANFRAAHALVREAQAQLYPTLTLNPAVSRQKSSAALSAVGGGSAIPHTIYELPLEASYQLDLWGSVRNNVAVNRYSAQASAATLANTVLSTRSTLAQDYFQLRVADEQRRILERTVADDRASLRLTRSLVASGVDSEADVASAQAALQSALASATDVGVARAQYEHAIAVLIGVAPAALSIPYRRFEQKLPVVPVGVPSDLLERRPDIAAAERQVAQANAQIGVARAAYFPSLTLSATGGYESTALNNLFNVSNRLWSIGSSMVATLVDGGAHGAAVAQAEAERDSAAATYRQTVLTAFQSVEDNLAALRIYSTESAQAHAATVAAKRAVELAVTLFRNGLDSYVQLLTAQNTFLTTRQTELGIELKQLVASVTLINDLGGGWTASQRTQFAASAEHAQDAGKAAEDAGKAANVPAADSGPPSANPPPLPAGEIEPDYLIEQDADMMAPAP